MEVTRGKNEKEASSSGDAKQVRFAGQMAPAAGQAAATVPFPALPTPTSTTVAPGGSDESKLIEVQSSDGEEVHGAASAPRDSDSVVAVAPAVIRMEGSDDVVRHLLRQMDEMKSRRENEQMNAELMAEQYERKFQDAAAESKAMRLENENLKRALEEMKKKTASSMTEGVKMKRDLDRHQLNTVTLKRERGDLVAANARQQSEIERLQTELQEYSEKTITLNSKVCELQAKISDVETAKHSVASEKELLSTQLKLAESNLKWTEEQLNIKTEDLRSNRTKYDKSIQDLRAQLDDKSAEAKSLQKQLTASRSRNAETLGKLEETRDKMNEAEAEYTRRVQDLEAELDTQTALAANWEETSKKEKDRLSNVEKKIASAEERRVRELKAFEDREHKLKNEVQAGHDQLEKAQAEIAELKEAANQLTSRSRLEAEIGARLPASGSEIQVKLIEREHQMENLRLENMKLKKWIKTITREVQRKDPILQEQQAAYQRMERANRDLEAKLNESLHETERTRVVNGKLRERIDMLSREKKELQIKTRDLFQQNCDLLGRQEAVRPSGLLLGASHAADAINQELTRFRDVKELYSQHQRLLAVVRALSDRTEQAEKDGEQKQSLKLREATAKLEEIRNEYQTLETHLVALQHQNERQKELLANQKIVPETTLALRSAESTEDMSGTDAKHVMVVRDVVAQKSGGDTVSLSKYKELDTLFTRLKAEQEETMKQLDKETSGLRKEASSLRFQLARAQVDAKFAGERLSRMVTKVDGYRTEIKALRNQNAAVTKSLTKHQKRIQEIIRSWRAEEDKSKGLAAKLRKAETEKALLQKSETRLVHENASLVAAKQTSTALMGKLQQMELEIRKRGEQSFQTLMKEKKDLYEAHERLTRRHEAMQIEHRGEIRNLKLELETAQKRLEAATAQSLAAKNQMHEAKNALVKRESEVERLRDQKLSMENEAKRLQKSVENEQDKMKQLLSGRPELNSRQQLEEEVTELKKHNTELEKAREADKARMEKLSLEARKANDALKEYTATRTEERESFESKLSGALSQKESLTKRVEELKQHCMASDREVETLKDKVVELEAKVKREVDAANEAKKMAEEKLQAAEVNVAKLQEDVARSSKMCDEASDRYKRELKLHYEMREAVKVETMKVREAEKKKAEAEALAAEWKIKEEKGREEKASLVVSFEAERQRAEAKMKDFEREKELLQKQMEGLISQVDQLRSTETAIYSLDDDKAASSTANASATSTKDTVIRELRELQSMAVREKDQVQLKLKRALQQQAKYESMYNNTKKALDEAREQLATESQQQDTYDAVEHQKLMEKIQRTSLLEESNTTLRAQSERDRKRADDLETKCRSLEAEREPLRKERAVAEGKILMLESENRALSQENERWKKRNRQLLDKYQMVDAHTYNDLKLDHDRLQKTVEELQASLKTLDRIKEELKSLQEESKTLKAKAAEDAKKLEDQRARIEKLRAHTASWKSKQLKAAKENDELKKKVTTMTSSQEQKGLETKAALSSVHRLVSLLEILKASNGALKAHLDTAQKALESEKKNAEKKFKDEKKKSDNLFTKLNGTIAGYKAKQEALKAEHKKEKDEMKTKFDEEIAEKNLLIQSYFDEIARSNLKKAGAGAGEIDTTEDTPAPEPVESAGTSGSAGDSKAGSAAPLPPHAAPASTAPASQSAPTTASATRKRMRPVDLGTSKPPDKKLSTSKKRTPIVIDRSAAFRAVGSSPTTAQAATTPQSSVLSLKKRAAKRTQPSTPSEPQQSEKKVKTVVTLASSSSTKKSMDAETASQGDVKTVGNAATRQLLQAKRKRPAPSAEKSVAEKTATDEAAAEKVAAEKAAAAAAKKAAEAKADDAKQAAPTPSSRSDAKEDTSGADEKEGGERVERKAERKGREAKSAEAKAGNEEDDAGEESERSEDGDEDAKEKNKLSPPGKNPRLSSRESSPGPGDIPKHVLTMVGKWSHNAWLIFCLTDKIPKSPLSTEKKKPPASSAEEQEEAPDYQEAVGSPVLFEKALDRKMKWINHFIKSANGLDPDRMLQWAQHAESTFNGRLMFLQSVASFNMRGGDTAAAVMIDEVFPQIWAALRNSDQVDIFQPMFRGQMSQGGAEIVRGFFQSIAAILTSYVEMDEKDLPSTDLLRFRMYILLPFISSDVSSRGVQMFLDSGIAHALCRFALSPALNRLHPSVAAMAWRSFVHLVVVYLSKTTSECSEEHRQHLDQIVDVLKSQLKSDTMEIQRAGTFQDVPLTIGAKRRAFVDSLKVDDIIDARTYSGDWRVAKVVRVKPSSVFVTWRGYVMETNENIFKDSGRLAPFTSRASLELPQRDPDFHAAPFKLKEENLRRAGPTLLKAFAAGDKAEIEELNKYRPLNFRMFRCLDVLKILAAVASPCSTVCHELLSTLINSVRHPEKAIPGVLQLEFVRLLQAHLPACDHQIKETSETLFQLFSFISGGALSEVEKLTSNQIEVEEEAVEDVTEEIEKLQQIEANKKPATQKFNMEANWRCVMCRYDNPGKMHTCANCFIPREISQPEFPLFLKEQKENEGRKKELAKKLKEDEEKRLQAQKAKAEEKKKEDKAPEEKKKKTEPQDAKESERHVFQSWSESGVRNNSHKLLTWAMTDLFRTLLNGSSPSWEKAICEQVHLALSHIPSTLESLMSMSSKYESKSPLGGERISEKSWLNACDALAALQLLGGFEGNVYEGSYVVVQQSHQIVRRGWVKTVSPKLIVELCDPPSIGGQTQEIVCHRKDITPVALLDELSESHLFGEPAETQRAEIGKILSAVLKCLEASSLSRVPVPRKSAGFLYRTSAQQLAVGTCSVICKLFLKSLAAFRAPALKIDLEMLMPLFKFTKGKNFSGGFSDTSTALPTHWNALMELGMRSSEEKKFVRDIRAASYLLRPSQTSSDGSDEKLTKPTILQHVDTLCGLGFSKNMAKAALAASNGDLGQAGHMLTDGQVLDRDSTSAWKTCLRRLDLADSVAAWERMTAKESSMNTSKWRGKPGIASPQDIHMGSDVVGKESDSDTGFEWPEDALAHPVGLVVKFRHVDYPVRNLKFILGQRVRAQDMHHEWYDAEIIEVKGDWVKLHYDKFDHFWDEWIDVKRQWRKLQIPGAKKLSAFVRTVDHGLPFNLKAGVVWKVSDQNPSIVLVKFPGSGFQPTHFIWSDINDLEPYISSTATAASASLPGPQLSASLKALNETQMSHTLAVLQRTVKDTLLSHVGVSLSVLPGLRRVRQSAGNILQLLSCLSNPWNWTDDSDCSRFSEPAKLLVQELARAIGVNLLEETFETTGNACAERVRKKQLEQLSIDSSSGKTVGAGVEGIVLSEKPSWESLVVLLKSALQEEMKQFEVHSTQCTCEVRCQANGSYFIAAKGFSKTMVAFDRSYGGSPTVQFYSDRHRNRMLKKVACAVPPPFAMRLPLYVTVEGCSQEEGLSFLRRMVCFTPLHCNSLDILYVLVELLLYLINHPLVKSDETKSSGLQGLMSEAYRSLLRTSAKMWGEESPAAMPSLLKMQMLEVMSRLCIHQLTYKELPKVFSPCIEEIRSGGVLNGVLEEAAMRYDVEIGTSKASKDGLLSERGKPKLGKFLSRSTYLVKHVEFLTCVWEYMRRFKPSVFEEISQLEKKEETKKPVVTSTTPKPAPTQWSCPTCTYKNPPARTRCEMCGGAREQPSEPAPPKSPTPAEKKKDDTKTRERDLEKTNQLKLVVARLREIMSSSKMHEIGPVVTEGKAKTPADEKPGAGDGKATELKYVKGATLACKDTCGKWIDAEVRDTKENEIFVHYVNYDDRWDEWISTSSQRLRPRGDPAKDSKSTDEKKRDPEVSDKVVESICLLDLSLNSVWWPLFLHRVPQAREDLESEAKRAEGIDLTHEYSLTPLVPLAALLFDKKVRLALFDAIIKCSTIPNRKLPEITVDTSNIIGMGGAAERRSGSGLFGQIKHQFKRLSVAQFRGKLGEYSWATRWKGGRNQGSEGLPGPFQQSMGMIWTELNERAQRRDTRSPVILCPNGDLEIGDKDRDNLLLNPGLKSPSSFRCLGQLLGCVLRSSSSCSLPFSRTVWRALVYGHAHIIRRGFFEKIAELESFDKNQGRQLVRLITQSEAEFAALGYTYTTSLSNGRVIELFAGGHKHRVAYEDRLFYAELVLNARLEENVSQTDLVRQGVLAVIPRYSKSRHQTELSPICYLMTLEELERRVCGSPEIDLDLLKRKTVYKGAKDTSKIVEWFWNVMHGLSKRDRQRFIQFAWARSRLPHDMATNNNIKMLLNFTKSTDRDLPKAQTCFFLVDMPMYSSEEIMRDKLLLALNCDEINS
mmetsp:Transcript_21120/g.40952  ORF Transcript_21120/g.40952 Transcript_21120/m.40952 type:complete len:4306 (+) Transcript_21120:31-12948(+)